MRIRGITLVLESVCVCVCVSLSPSLSLSLSPCCTQSLYRSEVEERAQELGRSLEAAQVEREKEFK
jgi:hypothetical protein